MGQWYDKLKGGGTQVWDPSTYDNSPNAAANTGLQWKQINSAVPLSGWTSKLFTYNPRLGVAYDLRGNGRTVIRAGFGTYRYQVSDNDAGAAMNGPLGSFAFSTGGQQTPGFYGYNVASGQVYLNQAHTTVKQLSVPTALNQNGGTINVDKWHDDLVPYADTYSFGVAQALPSHTVMEVSYVGSASRHQLLGGGSNVLSPNMIPIGAFFKPDPVSGVLANPSGIQGSSDAAVVQQDAERRMRLPASHQNKLSISVDEPIDRGSTRISRFRAARTLRMLSSLAPGRPASISDMVACRNPVFAPSSAWLRP